jgi:uncharacterized membrane protein YdcZ (DUF606 family)
MKAWSSIGVAVAIVVIVAVFVLSLLVDSSAWLSGRRSAHVLAIILAAATILLGIALTAGVYA